MMGNALFYYGIEGGEALAREELRSLEGRQRLLREREELEFLLNRSAERTSDRYKALEERWFKELARNDALGLRLRDYHAYLNRLLPSADARASTISSMRKA